VSQLPKLFPTSDTENLVICVHGVGGSREFTTLITDVLPDRGLVGASQCFPLYYYEEVATTKRSSDVLQSCLFTVPEKDQATNYRKKDGVSDFILTKAREQYQIEFIMKEDIFYYVYGFLHSKSYRETFSADLKKMLPHLPLVERYTDFVAFSKAGRTLADLHLHYETVLPYPGVKVCGEESDDFRVKKMRFLKRDRKDIIIYNKSITISSIPTNAYKYIVNGKSAIEWIMERYQVKTDPKSGITNDPNAWAEEHENPRYILDLILSVITVSVETMKIVEKLPFLRFEG
jgi:predicted helicase